MIHNMTKKKKDRVFPCLQDFRRMPFFPERRRFTGQRPRRVRAAAAQAFRMDWTQPAVGVPPDAGGFAEAGFAFAPAAGATSLSDSPPPSAL